MSTDAQELISRALRDGRDRAASGSSSLGKKTVATCEAVAA